MKKYFVPFLALTLILITLPMGRTSAQDPDQAPHPDHGTAVFAATPFQERVEVRVDPLGGGQNLFIARHEDHQQTARFHHALEAYKSAESESGKEDAKKELHDLLVEQYDNSLTRYEEHLSELEKKIAEMREQLARRRSAKDEVVDLKLQMVLSEADGLGWPEGGVPNLFFPGEANVWGAHAGDLVPEVMPSPVMPAPPAQSTAPRPRRK